MVSTPRKAFTSTPNNTMLVSLPLHSTLLAFTENPLLRLQHKIALGITNVTDIFPQTVELRVSPGEIAYANFLSTNRPNLAAQKSIDALYQCIDDGESAIVKGAMASAFKLSTLKRTHREHYFNTMNDIIEGFFEEKQHLVSDGYIESRVSDPRWHFKLETPSARTYEFLDRCSKPRPINFDDNAPFSENENLRAPAATWNAWLASQWRAFVGTIPRLWQIPTQLALCLYTLCLYALFATVLVATLYWLKMRRLSLRLEREIRLLRSKPSEMPDWPVEVAKTCRQHAREPGWVEITALQPQAEDEWNLLYHDPDTTRDEAADWTFIERE
ncbi:hypothetical protein K402DRAFT_440157 [Aulographum hederae CBS 113979]|uniref:Uncharacterized protein n=1 Tax=Aulographum hederae CBS 113979 TaxID=1176131 RepID=A0A6G1GLA5_9PEZI|nr:hypothetical protein K402DRAFT_440157 [Aulographum hederae CBS 113979]